MSGNLQREAVGTTLTQSEYEASDGGGIQFASQATGDVPYASSTTVIEALGIGSANQVLIVSGGIPAWSSNVNVQGTLDAQGAATLASTLAVTGAVTLSSTLKVDDSQNIILGTGNDATISYDGTDLVIAPAAVGVGDVHISGGSLEVDDSEAIRLGTGKDATISYDGTDLTINPQAVGSGDLIVGGAVILDQGAADDQILNMKSSDVSHGMTSIIADDSIYAFWKKATSTGALHVEGLGDGKFGFLFNADYVTDDTAKSSSGRAPMEFNARKKSGTSITAPGADANIIAFQGNGTTKYLIDQEGDTWQAGRVHAQVASASVTAATTADELVVENTAAGGISILTNNNVDGSLFFGDSDDNDIGGIIYAHGSNNLRVRAEGGIRFHVDATGIQVNSTGTTVNRSVTDSSNGVNIFNGDTPSGTLANGATLYATGAELWVADGAGSPHTQLSPHDDEGNWWYNSKDPVTGRRFVVHMEKMMKALNDHFGWDFIEETEL